MPFQHPHLDAAGNVLFAEQLNAARAQAYDTRFPELQGRSLVPVNNSEDPGLETITWYEYTTVGSYKLITAYADDLPRSDVQAQQNFALVRDGGGSYGYNINEVYASATAGKPLPAQRAAAKRRSYETEIDVLIALGDSKSGLVGLLNQPNPVDVTIPAGASTQTEWVDKTPAEIYADLVLIRRAVKLATNGVEDINTIILPDDQFGIITDTFFNEDLSASSILQTFQSKYPGIEVLSWWRCAGAGSGGTDRAVAYRRDPNYMEFRIPKEDQELPPEQRNLETVINSHARIGGLIVYYPLSMAYADLI